MRDLDLTDLVWRKSSRSSEGPNCVEVTSLSGYHLVRDSKNPAGPALTFAPSEWCCFLTQIKTGSFTDRLKAGESAL